MNKKVVDLLLVSLGSLIAAIGFNTMILENHIASGGLGGLAVSFQALFGWKPSFFVLIVNIPLLFICYVLLGRATFLKTVYGGTIYPIFIQLTSGLPNLTHTPLLAAVFGGIIVGFGLGLVFLGNSSTGGTGIITQVIHKYSPLPLGTSMVLIDGLVVAVGLAAFDADSVMYSIISLIVISYVVNIMMTGFNASKNLMIISHHHEKIKHYITISADRGVTEIPIHGGFTGKDRFMLMTTISTHEFPKIEKEILAIDETAFIVVMPASHVVGRGFSLTKHYQNEDEDILLPM